MLPGPVWAGSFVSILKWERNGYFSRNAEVFVSLAPNGPLDFLHNPTWSIRSRPCPHQLISWFQAFAHPAQLPWNVTSSLLVSRSTARHLSWLISWVTFSGKFSTQASTFGTRFVPSLFSILTVPCTSFHLTSHNTRKQILWGLEAVWLISVSSLLSTILSTQDVLWLKEWVLFKAIWFLYLRKWENMGRSIPSLVTIHDILRGRQREW